MSIREFSMELEVKKELHYKDGWGIYSCVPVHYTTEIKLHNIFRNFVIRGITRKLKQGERYEISFTGEHIDPKRGSYYELIDVAPEKLDTLESQNKFLQSIISENQFNTLRKVYPEGKLVDMVINNEIDTSKTKGIKDKTINKIKEKIKENEGLSILIAGTKGMNITTNTLKKISNYYGSPSEAIDKINNDIYDLCNIPSMGFLSVDKIAMSRNDSPESSERINAAIKYTLEREMSNGHSWTSKNTLSEKCTKILYINSQLVDEQMNKLKDSSIYYVSASNQVSFRYVLDQEQAIYNNLNRIEKNYTNKPNKQAIESRLVDIEKEQGFTFTEEQRNAIVEGSQCGVVVINGKAGTGKSSIVNGLIQSLGDVYYNAATLSGKAAGVLRSKDVEASTIHRMMGFDPESETRFAHNKQNPLGFDLLILDEVSMIDVSLFKEVTDAVKNGCKLVIVGDSGQLSAISFGDVLRDLIESKAFPVYELTQVLRQAKASGILSLANSVRDGNQIMPYNASGREVFGELQDQTVISYGSNKEIIPKDIISIAKQYATTYIKSDKDILDFQILVPVREKGDLSVLSLNTELQKVFNDMSKTFITSYSYNYREKDKIIQNGNSYGVDWYKGVDEYFKEKVKEIRLGDDYVYNNKTDLYNGTLGIIKDLYTKEEENVLLVEFEGMGGIIAIDDEAMKKIEMAYALTVHKAQGSGFANLIFAFDFSSFSLLSRELVYTGITRAIQKCVILCENNAMHKAISISSSKERRTFLADIMRESMLDE